MPVSYVCCQDFNRLIVVLVALLILHLNPDICTFKGLGLGLNLQLAQTEAERGSTIFGQAWAALLLLTLS